MSDGWVEYDDGEIIITEEAPDHVFEFFEKNGDYARALVNFRVTCIAAGYDGQEDKPEPYEWRELKETHIDKMKDAVQAGDIEAAQKHLTFAQSFKKTGKTVSAVLRGSHE